ncbi:MAG: hypothetical protein HYR56_05015 [Acidobacteria bacterium]|nr:hypothetical protein [Acidobacteriota bacterium]MBI3426955.1 hypothetical protein [Acidobacteriota bacterium]
MPGERGGITALDVAALSYFLFGVVPDTPVFEVLSADDNSREQLPPASNTLYVNYLTPARAPSTLESVRVQLPPDAVGKQLRIVIFHDPQRTGQPPVNPTFLVNQTLMVPTLPAHGMLEVMLGAPGPLPRGDLYVGVQAVNGDISFAADTTTPRGRSFASMNNGASFQPLLVNGAAANAMLRATVNSKFNAVGNHPPELTALSINATPAGAPLRLTVYGNHFYPVSDDAAGLRYSTVIRVNGQPQGTEFLGASQLRAEIPAAALGTGPTARVTVFTQTPAGGLESAPLDLALTPIAPVPVLARLEPATVAIAGGQKLLIVNGRNFLNTTVVRVNGMARPTTYRSDAKLEVTLTDAGLAQAGALNLTAFNGAPGGGVSNALPLTVAGCIYTLSLNGQAYQPSRVGETLDGFLLETPDHCPWTATASAAWVRIEGPTSGVGRAPIGFTVFNNPAGGGRQATINVGGKSFQVSQPSGLTAVSSANYAPLTAVDAIATIFSNDLAVTTQAATTTPLPTTLAGTRVTMRGLNNQELNCPLFFVSPTQINLLIHPGLPMTAPGDQAIYTTLASVYVNDVLVASGNVQLTNVAPSFFTANATGQGVPAGVVLRVKANGSQSFEPLAEFDQATNRFVAKAINLGPAGERVFVVLFGTGFRRRTGLENVSVSIAGLALPVSFAGAQGDLAGLDQLNVEMERALAGHGEVTLQTLIDNRPANAVTIRMQ